MTASGKDTQTAPANAANPARPDARLLTHPIHLLALGFGSGLVPRAPGTAGSLVALIPAWLIAGWPLAWQAGTVAALAVAGIWICGASARRLGLHDHPAIVYDEIVGFMALVMVLPAQAAGAALLGWLILAFVLFRTFDIFKPWPIRDLDHRLSGGLGIMLDDLMAAVYAAVCIVAVSLVLPGA